MFMLMDIIVAMEHMLRLTTAAARTAQHMIIGVRKETRIHIPENGGQKIRVLHIHRIHIHRIAQQGRKVMATKIKCSVVVPNHGRDITKLIESIPKSKSIEIVVVDEGKERSDQKAFQFYGFSFDYELATKDE